MLRCDWERERQIAELLYLQNICLFKNRFSRSHMTLSLLLWQGDITYVEWKRDLSLIGQVKRFEPNRFRYCGCWHCP
ncbi:hypothetical protein CEXT_685361 [Caerostris extrusa]|uniref:Uncharacterized protein n=1 Tax=Caerostris extrusa TaxID=172846 RepID=A0AAV4MRT7_CAEEX|nr:hypothetical protein CEXT_685361 [Caerostris extrusa]